MCSYITIYFSEGVSEIGVSHLSIFFKTFLLDKKAVRVISKEQLLEGDWIKDTKLFIMPGGRDLPYVKDLTPFGNVMIRKYISNGGSYLGICAGAYYSGNFVEFDKGLPSAIVGPRELSLFPGTVRGPCLKAYDPFSHKGSLACSIESSLNYLKTLKIFYSGGGFFVDAEKMAGVDILAYTFYNSNKLPMIIGFCYGKGRVILSGVHPEYDPDFLNPSDPYLISIINELKPFNDSRKQFLLNLLDYLKVELS